MDFRALPTPPPQSEESQAKPSSRNKGGKCLLLWWPRLHPANEFGNTFKVPEISFWNLLAMLSHRHQNFKSCPPLRFAPSTLSLTLAVQTGLLVLDLIGSDGSISFCGHKVTKAAPPRTGTESHHQSPTSAHIASLSSRIRATPSLVGGSWFSLLLKGSLKWRHLNLWILRDRSTSSIHRLVHCVFDWVLVPSSLWNLYFYLKCLVFPLASTYGRESERFMCTLGRQDERREKRKHTRMNHVTDRDKQRWILDGATTEESNGPASAPADEET